MHIETSFSIKNLAFSIVIKEKLETKADIDKYVGEKDRVGAEAPGKDMLTEDYQSALERLENLDEDVIRM